MDVLILEIMNKAKSEIKAKGWICTEIIQEECGNSQKTYTLRIGKGNDCKVWEVNNDQLYCWKQAYTFVTGKNWINLIDSILP